jgi:hypothetical protein
MGDLGRKFAVALGTAAVTAVGFVFTALDFEDKIGRRRRATSLRTICWPVGSDAKAGPCWMV